MTFLTSLVIIVLLVFNFLWAGLYFYLLEIWSKCRQELEQVSCELAKSKR